VHVILSATTSKALGLISGELSSSTDTTESLPDLAAASARALRGPTSADPHGASVGRKKRIRFQQAVASLAPARKRADDAHDSAPIGPVEAASSESIMTKECFEGTFFGPAGHDDPSSESVDSGTDADDDPDIETADSNLTDAVIGKILLNCDNNPCPDTTFSTNDMIYGLNASEAEIANCGLPGKLVSGGVLSIAQVRAMQAVVRRNEAAFATSSFPIANAAPPIQVRLKAPDPTRRYQRGPVHLPPPVWGPNKRKYLHHLLQRGLKTGELVPNNKGEWATRVHIVGKGSKNDAGEYVKGRTIDDARPLNEQTERLTNPVANGITELRRLSRRSFCKVIIDATSAFKAFRVHVDSQHFFTVWLPLGPNPEDGAGKFMSTRMIFGWCNSPAYMNEFYDEMVATLPREVRDMLSKFYDDFGLSAPDYKDTDRAFAEFLVSFEALLRAAIKFRVQFSPQKFACGLKEHTFYGFRVDLKGGSSLAAHNLDAIRALRHPTNAAEAKSVIGLLTQSRNWVSQFSHHAARIIRLTKNDVTWNWRPEVEGKDFETLRRLLLTATANYHVNPDYCICVQTDASDFGCGDRRFQVIDGVEYNIGFSSRSFTVSEQSLVIYFRECIAVLEGILNARIYALSSAFKLKVYTDHLSLIFTKTCRSGPLSVHRLAAVADVDYEIIFIKGKLNHWADFFSRYPMTGPRTLAAAGLLAAFTLLLKHLGDAHRDDNNIWVSALGHTTAAARLVQGWRRPKSAIKTGTPLDNKIAAPWEWAVLAVAPTKSPPVCHKMLLTGKPFCMLMNIDLLLAVALDAHGKFSQKVFDLLKQTRKIMIVTANYCWVVAGSTGMRDIVVMSAGATTMRPALTLRDVDESSAETNNAATDYAASDGGGAYAGLLGHGVQFLQFSDYNADGVDSDMDVDAAAATAAQTFAGRLKVKQLRKELADRDANSTGRKAVLVDRLVELLGENFVDPVDAADAATRQNEASIFYDDPAYANSKPGERRHIVEQLLDTIGPTSEWKQLQRDADCEEEFRVRRPGGMMLCNKQGQSNLLIVVPRQKRKRLLDIVHTELGHNVRSMMTEVSRAFYWTGMRNDIARYCAACIACLRNKKRVQNQHNLWRNRVYFQPRSFYSIDVKKIGKGDNVTFVLVVVDRFSSYVITARMADKRTSTVISAIMTNVVWKFGEIIELTIDSEKAFTSAVFKAWTKVRGIKLQVPFGYHSTGNAHGEVYWKHFEAEMTASGDFPGDAELDASIAFAWNIQTKDGTGLTPFAIQHGSPATTAAVHLAQGMSRLRAPTAAEKRQFVQDNQRSTAAIVRLAARRGNYRRRVSAINLNRRHNAALSKLKCGDKAFVYQPPSGAIVASRGHGRNKAFVSSFTGPATVTFVRSNTGYQLKDDATGVVYERHRTHIRPIPMLELD
jgi:hypothetical protein